LFDRKRYSFAGTAAEASGSIALIELHGVEHLAVDGSFSAQDLLDDATVRSESADIENWKDLLERQPVTAVRLMFGSGTTIDVRCHGAPFRLERAIRFLETWNGPLVTNG
jgi:hypothetical protein